MMDPKPVRWSLPSALLLLSLVKLWSASQGLLHPPPSVPRARVSLRPAALLDPTAGTFTVTDRTNVSFLLQPHHQVCGPNTTLVLLALSALDNRQQRAARRLELGDRGDVALLFLLAEAGTLAGQSEVELEHSRHDDLLQVSDPESYRRLSYKTLSGFLWTSVSCPQARHVAKMDDDVSVDLGMLLAQLEDRPGDFISCPSVMRNVRPTRQNRTGSTLAKWNMPHADMPRRVYPDFCPGWLYVTTPRVALALAEVAATHATEVLPMAKMDDVFVTGVLRERLAMELTQLDRGPWSSLWDHGLSHCHFLSGIKNVFFNDIVLAKGSRSHPYIKGYKFVACILLENTLESLESMAPSLGPTLGPLWRPCARY